MKENVVSRDRAAELREAFDHAFQQPPLAANPALENLLAIGVAGERYGVRLSEICGLLADLKVVPLPGPMPALLGIAGMRGRIVPVYSLGRLLGGECREPPRWTLLAGPDGHLGLAFERFQGYVQVPAASLTSAEPDEAGRLHVRQATRLGEILLPILDVASILEAIQLGVGAEDPRGRSDRRCLVTGPTGRR